jgi:hypothetical protein
VALDNFTAANVILHPAAGECAVLSPGEVVDRGAGNQVRRPSQSAAGSAVSVPAGATKGHP